MGLRTLQPRDWSAPKGYANGLAGRGTIVVVGGQVGWNERQQFESDDFVARGALSVERGDGIAQPHHGDAVGMGEDEFEIVADADHRLALVAQLLEDFADMGRLAHPERRSQAVADALRAQGVDPSRISTRGYGEAYPVASNSSTSDRALNRRVEVYISNDNQPVRARG